MGWSLGESGALALKAARGAGFSWGVAEEAAQAVVWLHERGHPGVAALCAYLDMKERRDADGASADGAACPIATGCAIIDGIHDLPDGGNKVVALGVVHAPLLLLPFVAIPGDGAMDLKMDMGGTALGFGDARAISDAISAGDAAHRCANQGCTVAGLVARAPCILRVREGGAKVAPVTCDRVGDGFACCMARLADFAGRTYAPATSSSRLAGAGAGLTDND